MTLDMAAPRGFSSGVVKSLVSFYRSGEDFAFERHRSRVTFDLASQSNVVAIKPSSSYGVPWLKELAMKFGMVEN